MGQGCLTSDAWSDNPADDAKHFYATIMPMARGILSGDVPPTSVGLEKDVDAIVVVFPFGGREHKGWQLAAIQTLAREVAPKRANGVSGDEGGPDASNTMDEVIAWLATAPGVTGQLLAVR
jgi:hypothetical protein